MEERITASLLPSSPPPTPDVANGATAGGFSVGQQRARPDETDWLMKNGLSTDAPNAPLLSLGMPR